MESNDDKRNQKRPASFWIVEWIQFKELTNNWTKLRTSNIKSPDPCNFIYLARINGDIGLDIQVRKESPKPGRAHLTISFIDTAVDRMIKLDYWVDDYSFWNILEFDILQKHDRVHMMILNVWYGFIDEILTPLPTQFSPGAEYFYLNEELSDFRILMGDETIPVHKFLLASHSREFLKMFTTPMKESQDNCVVIEDVEAKIMKEVLKWIYKRDASSLNDVDTSLKVLMVAEKYGLETLKYICENKLLGNLSVDNALSMLDIADMYNAVQLKRYTILFLIAHKKEVVHRADFKEIYHQKPELLFDFITMALGK